MRCNIFKRAIQNDSDATEYIGIGSVRVHDAVPSTLVAPTPGVMVSTTIAEAFFNAAIACASGYCGAPTAHRVIKAPSLQQNKYQTECQSLPPML